MSENQPFEKNDHRIEYLDTIRGLAALSVVFYHVLASHWDWMKITKIAYMVFNGSDAVAMFFVLSGLVLSLKVFQKNLIIDTEYYRKYFVARIFRLYPAFLVMLLTYYITKHYSENLLSLFIDTFYRNPYYFWEEALLIRDHHDLFLPDWTLGIEIGISLLVPFFILLCNYNQKLFIYFILITIFIGKIYISEFVLHFCLGILIAKNFNYILQYKDQSNWWYKNRWVIFPVVLFFYSIRHVLHLFPLPHQIQYLFNNILFISEFTFTGIAAALILMYVINTQWLQDFLNKKILLFLGKISYGVYLSHWFFTGLVISKFDYIKSNFANNSEINFLIIYLIIAVSGSIICGSLLYYFVEKPFITLGKKVVNKFK